MWSPSPSIGTSAAAAVRTRRMASSRHRSARRRSVSSPPAAARARCLAMLMDAACDTVTPAQTLRSARIRQSTLHRMLETMRQQDSIHRKAGSVHGCALFSLQGGGCEKLYVRRGRGPPQRHRHHLGLDVACTASPVPTRPSTRPGRLTSEMVMKSRTDGRAHRRLTQRRHRDGARAGDEAGHDAFRPRGQPPLPLLHRLPSASTPSPNRSVPPVRVVASG